MTIARDVTDCLSLPIIPPHRLPGETVQYLMASRYCPSDQFQPFADAEFGSIEGGAKVIAMRDWIAHHFSDRGLPFDAIHCRGDRNLLAQPYGPFCCSDSFPGQPLATEWRGFGSEADGLQSAPMQTRKRRAAGRKRTDVFASNQLGPPT